MAFVWLVLGLAFLKGPPSPSQIPHHRTVYRSYANEACGFKFLYPARLVLDVRQEAADRPCELQLRFKKLRQTRTGKRRWDYQHVLYVRFFAADFETGAQNLGFGKDNETWVDDSTRVPAELLKGNGWTALKWYYTVGCVTDIGFVHSDGLSVFLNDRGTQSAYLEGGECPSDDEGVDMFLKSFKFLHGAGESEGPVKPRQ